MDQRCAASGLSDELLRQGGGARKFLRAARRRAGAVDDSDNSDASDDYDSDASDSGSDGHHGYGGYAPAPAAIPFGGFTFGTGAAFGGFGGFGGFVPRCRRCLTPGVDGRTCPMPARHKHCQACAQLFPEPEATSSSSSSDPPGGSSSCATQCALCRRTLCDAVWRDEHRRGGPISGCAGWQAALRPLAEHVMVDVPNAAFNSNVAEVRILREYLTDHKLTASDAWKELLAGLAAGTVSAEMNGVEVKSGELVACLACAVKLFASLCYDYRTKLATLGWREYVAKRPDCHWGRNCRTQTHNAAHAERFNHVCEQSKI
eukprot:TRINITY_DN1909_c0_g1_i1.p1 TRINITY_DN1909_c0_g1~~TRINITY_DN1909_c0_g1_i1.p1  ORF type:complete len:317 (-),score=92.77 TRINITY_DN1909_c0_g1_i1:80-1030(-)